ncbi:MAG: DUF2357 domain-containing protein [Bacteroidota bacterium]
MADAVLTFTHPEIGALNLHLSAPFPDQRQEDRRQKVGFGWTPAVPEHELPCLQSWTQIDLHLDLGKRHRPIQGPVFVQLHQHSLPLRPLDEARTQWMGRLNLQGQIGYTELFIGEEGQGAFFRWETEIVPANLPYQRDFHQMQEDISRIHFRLLQGKSDKSFGWLGPAPSTSGDLQDWYQQLNHLLPKLRKQLRALSREAPQAPIQREIQQAPLRKQAIRPKVLRKIRQKPHWISRSAQEGIPLGEGRFARKWQASTRHSATRQQAHQWVAWSLKEICRKLRLVQHQWPTHRQEEKLAFQRLWGFFQEMTRHPAFHIQPGSPQRLIAPDRLPSQAYRTYWQLFQQCEQALRWGSQPYLMADYKDMSRLYEYWCWVRLVEEISALEGMELIEQADFLSPATDEGHPLARGAAGAFVWQHQGSGAIWRLAYQQRFGREAHSTFTQIPDLSLDIESPLFPQSFRYFFDAKYRVVKDRSPAGWAPPAEAMAQLHRYRDAILPEKTRYLTYTGAHKSMGGLVFFPFSGPEESFRQHPFFRSIQETHIGALPMYPGEKSGSLLRAWLQEKLDRPATALFEEAITYDRKGQEKLIAASEKRLYLLPFFADLSAAEQMQMARRLSSFLLPLEEAAQLSPEDYVGLFEPQSGYLWGYGKLRKLRPVESEIWDRLELPGPQRSGDYLLVQWEAWQEIDQSMEVLKDKAFMCVNHMGWEAHLAGGPVARIWFHGYAWLRFWEEILPHAAQHEPYLRNQQWALAFRLKEQDYEIWEEEGRLWVKGQDQAIPWKPGQALIS